MIYENCICRNCRDNAVCSRDRMDMIFRVMEEYNTQLRQLKFRDLQKNRFITKSRSMSDINELILHIADIDSNVLITGETGVGKSMVAQMLHMVSSRAEGPFVEINCGVKPDIVVSAKSVAGGIPVACVTARKDIMDIFAPGELGGTYCGSALATASALKVLEIMKRDDYCAKARHIGEVSMKRFAEMQEKYDIVGDVRGIGAMLALEFVKDRETKEPAKEECKAIISECMANGLVVLGAGVRDSCIRFLLPLVITDEQMNAGFDILDAAIAKVTEK